MFCDKLETKIAQNKTRRTTDVSDVERDICAKRVKYNNFVNFYTIY